jgi:hypothetical protein
MDHDDEHPRSPIRWRPTLGLKGLLFGLLAGLGLTVLMQQLGWLRFELSTLALWAIAGVVAGGLVASLGYAVAVARRRRRRSRAQQAADEDARDQPPAGQGGKR